MAVWPTAATPRPRGRGFSPRRCREVEFSPSERKIQLVSDFIQQLHETLLSVTRENLVQCYNGVKCKTSFSAHKFGTNIFSGILKYLLVGHIMPLGPLRRSHPWP